MCELSESAISCPTPSVVLISSNNASSPFIGGCKIRPAFYRTIGRSVMSAKTIFGRRGP
jgi:hypothetical protein